MSLVGVAAACRWSFPAASGRVRASSNGFPLFLPKEVGKIRDRHARDMARRIERIPVQTTLADAPIMSSCVKPQQQQQNGGWDPVLLLHGFDSCCLEWRYAYPLLEAAGVEAWAVDVLGWGFSALLPRGGSPVPQLLTCNVAAKREHLYELWRAHIGRPVVLVGPSLGAAVALDFAAAHPEAVSELVLVDASVYAEGTGGLAKLPRIVADLGVAVLKSVPVRLYAISMASPSNTFPKNWEWMKVGRLHCLMPSWHDATVDFMLSGGYDVGGIVGAIKQHAVIIWGAEDSIVPPNFGERLQKEMAGSVLHLVPDCGHLPHVEKPDIVANLIASVVKGGRSRNRVEQLAGDATSGG